MNGPSSISNAPSPVPENETGGSEPIQITRAEQQQIAGISELVPEEQRSQAVSSFLSLQQRENSSVSTDPAPQGRRPDVSPGRLPRPKRLRLSAQEAPGQAEKPRMKFETQSNEIQQKILSLAVPPGSRADKLSAMNNLANVSKNFEAQVEAGPLQHLNRLTALRTQQENQPVWFESELDHAVRLKRKYPSLTREEVVFVAINGSNSELENSLQLQPAQVQDMISVLRVEFRREPNEDEIGYAVRLKKERPDLTPQQATWAMSDSNSLLTEYISAQLEFQTSEVQAIIANIRTKHPLDNRLDLNHQHYGVRLMKDHYVPVELAALAALDSKVEVATLLELSERLHGVQSREE